jgi:hypothetical protein
MKNTTKAIALAFLSVGSAGALPLLFIETFGNRSNYIPQSERVQQGFTIPSKLEIDVLDQDGNGKDETILSYDGHTYLLKLDKEGRPFVQAYDIKPVELVPRE